MTELQESFKELQAKKGAVGMKKVKKSGRRVIKVQDAH